MKSRRGVMGTGVCGVVFGAGLVLGGCTAPPPSGQNSGRVPTTTTTPGERNSAQVLPTALFEFSDQVAQQIAADVNEVPELNSGYRSTVIFGDIVNKTQIVSTTDFEAFRTRLRGLLVNSKSVSKNIKFIENRRNIEGLRNEELGGGDLLQEGQGGGSPRPDPQYTFFLRGEMYRVARENVNLYMLNFQLTRASDGAIVWQNVPYEVKQVR